MPGKLYVVGLPIGNLEDITLRAIRVLSQVDVIYTEDTRRARILLNRYHIVTRTFSCFAGNERMREREVLQKLARGNDIAYVSENGTPGISDPGSRLVDAAVRESFDVVPVPGASSVTSALSVGGLGCDRFAFVGFLPRSKARARRLLGTASDVGCVVIFESPFRVLATLGLLEDEFGDKPAIVLRELTKLHEEHFRGRISELRSRLAESKVRGEFVIIVKTSA